MPLTFSTSHVEGQNRVVFDGGGLVNPKKEVGKVGIRHHNLFTQLFHSTIKDRAYNKETRREETVYLNKKSAVQWINAQSDAPERISEVSTDAEVLRKIQTIAESKIDWTQHANHHKGQPSQKRLNSFFDRFKGFFCSLYWDIALSSWILFRARFQLVKSEKTRYSASQVRANNIFQKATREVPAYQRFTADKRIRRFNDIPIMEKDNYIKKYDITDTMVGGRLPLAGQIDTSTGTSGKPTMWVRGPNERQTVKTLLNFAAKVVVQNQPLFLINSFALGPWATGITTAGALVETAITFNPGPDADKILDFLIQFPPEKHQDRVYVIAGYPPFMKILLERAKERNVDLSQYPLRAVVGGEACSDHLRQTLIRSEQNPQGFIEVFSSYGASDLDINIGYESPFELQLREACRKNPEMAAELYGSNEPVPMIFHYDPMNYYIETNDDQHLIFTCVRDDRCSPRIRYNLKDRGKVMPMSDVQAIMKKYGVEIDAPNTNLPMLFIWGREGTVNYRGAKVPHEHLQEAFEKIPGLKGNVSNYAFNTRTDNEGAPVVEIWMEMKKGESVPENIQELQNSLIENLKAINQDFRFQIEKAPEKAHPVLKLFDNGTAGYLSNQDPHRKKKYVLDNGK